MSGQNIVRFVQKAAEGDINALSVDDFVAYMPMHNYIFKPTRETWPATTSLQPTTQKSTF